MIRIFGKTTSLYVIASDSEPAIGRKAEHLLRLDREGVKILDTIVLDASVFDDYLQTGLIKDSLLNEILTSLDDGDFSRVDGLALRPSTAIECQGMPDIIFSDKSYTQLKYNIEKIYRYWSEERCKAYRVSRRLVEVETWPAVVIQPKIDDVQTVICRSSRTGQRVSLEDSYNIHYSVHNFSSIHAELAGAVELALKSPVKIHFVEIDGKCLVLSISDQPMLESVKHAVLMELLDKGSISDINFVLALNFDSLLRQPGFYEDEYSKDEFIQGIAGGSSRVVRGQVVFSTSDLEKFADRSTIFTCVETSPEECAYISFARAAMASTGGKSSHLATVCRGWGKPCVVGLGEMIVDERAKRMTIRGVNYPELHEFIISGTTGRLYLTDKTGSYKVRPEQSRIVERLAEITNSIAGSPRLRALALPAQEKIAEAIFLVQQVESSK